MLLYPNDTIAGIKSSRGVQNICDLVDLKMTFALEVEAIKSVVNGY